MATLDLCIVNSPLFREFNPLYDEDSLPPLGLGYIATATRQAGLSVVLIDAVADRIPLNKLIENVLALNPKAVGINVFTTNLELVKDFVETVSNPHRKIIVGGLSTRTLYEEVFSWQCAGQVDVIFGDGELIVPDLLLEREKQKPDETRQNKRFFKVTTGSPYFCHDISSLWLDRSFFANEPVIHPRGFVEANIIASRGCIYNCSFCAAARSLNHDLAIRERSTDSLISEIDEIVT